MAEKLPELFEKLLLTGKNGLDDDYKAMLHENFDRTCAVLVLDSTGFTRVTHARGILHFLSLFLQMRKIVGKLFKDHDCLHWRSEADNLFAEFATPGQALEAALAAHAAMDKARLPLVDNEYYKVCIGIGYGTLLDGGEKGMFGDEMNLACKLGEDIAEGGETLLTSRAYENLERKGHAKFEPRRFTVSGNDISCYSANR